ncbi:hypothetical protein ES705_20733 [subsurface metagenome]
MALPKPLTYENLDEFTPLEFILLIGPAGTGKSFAILSLADIWQKLKPGGKIYAIDCETGLAKTYKAAFPHLKNILIWHGDQVNDSDKFIDIFSELGKTVTPDDWLCIESDTRVWDMCQDTGWLKVTGQLKDKYLSHRLVAGGPVTPQPDQLWQVVLDAYRRRFRDVLVNEVRMRTNILITTGLSSKSSPFTKASRQDTMKQLGIDISPDGHSENTRNPDTVIMLSRESDSYRAEVLKDRGSDKPGQRVKFRVESFLSDLMTNCR